MFNLIQDLVQAGQPISSYFSGNGIIAIIKRKKSSETERENREKLFSANPGTGREVHLKNQFTNSAATNCVITDFCKQTKWRPESGVFRVKYG